MSKFKVYKTTNTLTGDFYIGAHSGEKPNYLGSGPELKSAIKALGGEHFSKEIIAEFDTPEEAYALETELITEALKSTTNCYNLKPSTGGGLKQSTGKATVKDTNGTISQIDMKDQEIIQGNLVSINKGTVVVKDKDGRTFRTSSDDPRLKTGELVSYHKNKVVVRNKNGKNFFTDKHDDRLKTGELEYAGSATFIKPGQHLNQATEFKVGDKWMYNPVTMIGERVPKNEIENKLKLGWLFGRGGPSKKWIHNPITGETKRLPLSEIDFWIAKGWTYGR